MRWWLRQLGDRKLNEITPPLIAEARDALGRDASPRAGAASEATRNRYLAVLSHAFSIAEKEWGWVDQNPCRKVRRSREARGRARFLSDPERERLLLACQKSSEPRLYPLVVLALATGARQGELLRLRWVDVDFERGQAVLHHTKNSERRALPISRLTAEVLRALEVAEVEGFRFHDLRHSAASYLAMSGATLAEIAEVLGHKTLAMVKRYSHLTDQHTQSVVERMNGRIFGTSGRESSA